MKNKYIIILIVCEALSRKLPLPPVYLTTKPFHSKLDGLTERVIDWQTWLLSDNGLDNTCTCSFMPVLLVWSCHRLYSQLGGSSLKLDSQDQRAEEESISIKLKTPPSLFKTAANGKIGQCLWLRARQCISAFRQADGLTQKDRKEGGRGGDGELRFLLRNRNICKML